MITCPHCDSSHYTENFSTRTLGYYQPIYKNGINTNPDANITTQYCYCLDCHHNFKVKIQYGQIIELRDEGEAYTAPVIKMPPPSKYVDEDYYHTKYVPEKSTLATVTIDTSTQEPMRQQYQWEVGIEKLQEQVSKLTQEIEGIKELLKLNEHL